MSIILAIILSMLATYQAHAASKTQPHGNSGILEAFDGKPLPVNIKSDQKAKLDIGEPIAMNERVGKSGRGVVIQDINASIPIIMDNIRNVAKYPKYVSTVKSVEIYDSVNFKNGTSRSAAQFNVKVLGLGFTYYLLLTHEPKYNTLTWTLDYKRSSDFEDNVGHWQVMKHPTKQGWSRVLYSTKIKLFSWIPEFVVNFLTKKALLEATSWVKRESEAEAARQAAKGTHVGNGRNGFALKVPKGYFPPWLISGGFSSKTDYAMKPVPVDEEGDPDKGRGLWGVGVVLSRTFKFRG